MVLFSMTGTVRPAEAPRMSALLGQSLRRNFVGRTGAGVGRAGRFDFFMVAACARLFLWRRQACLLLFPVSSLTSASASTRPAPLCATSRWRGRRLRGRPAPISRRVLRPSWLASACYWSKRTLFFFSVWAICAPPLGRGSPPFLHNTDYTAMCTAIHTFGAAREHLDARLAVMLARTQF